MANANPFRTELRSAGPYRAKKQIFPVLQQLFAKTEDKVVTACVFKHASTRFEGGRGPVNVEVLLTTKIGLVSNGVMVFGE
jgi:hypothetical protein